MMRTRVTIGRVDVLRVSVGRWRIYVDGKPLQRIWHTEPTAQAVGMAIAEALEIANHV